MDDTLIPFFFVILPIVFFIWLVLWNLFLKNEQCNWLKCDEKESAKQPDIVVINAYEDIYYIDENHHTTANLNRIQSSENNQTSLRVQLPPEIILTPSQNITRYTTAEKNPPSYLELECDQLPSYASLYPSI